MTCFLSINSYIYTTYTSYPLYTILIPDIVHGVYIEGIRRDILEYIHRRYTQRYLGVYTQEVYVEISGSIYIGRIRRDILEYIHRSYTQRYIGVYIQEVYVEISWSIYIGGIHRDILEHIYRRYTQIFEKFYCFIKNLLFDQSLQ